MRFILLLISMLFIAVNALADGIEPYRTVQDYHVGMTKDDLLSKLKDRKEKSSDPSKVKIMLQQWRDPDGRRLINQINFEDRTDKEIREIAVFKNAISTMDPAEKVYLVEYRYYMQADNPPKQEELISQLREKYGPEGEYQNNHPNSHLCWNFVTGSNARQDKTCRCASRSIPDVKYCGITVSATVYTSSGAQAANQLRLQIIDHYIWDSEQKSLEEDMKRRRAERNSKQKNEKTDSGHNSNKPKL